MRLRLPIGYLLGTLVLLLGITFAAFPAQAARVDPFIRQYLLAEDTAPLKMDAEGHTQRFSANDLTLGKQLFSDNCKSCHVGGATLPNPVVSLSLDDLKGATPPRDTIQGLMAFSRQPITYDGEEESVWCRQVPETWLSESQLQKLDAFILRAAEKAPGWGAKKF